MDVMTRDVKLGRLAGSLVVAIVLGSGVVVAASGAAPVAPGSNPHQRKTLACLRPSASALREPVPQRPGVT
jgi:hypothetical protein